MSAITESDLNLPVDTDPSSSELESAQMHVFHLFQAVDRELVKKGKNWNVAFSMDEVIPHEETGYVIVTFQEDVRRLLASRDNFLLFTSIIKTIFTIGEAYDVECSQKPVPRIVIKMTREELARRPMKTNFRLRSRR